MPWWLKGLLFTILLLVALIGVSLLICEVASHSLDPFATGRLAQQLGGLSFILWLLGTVSGWMYFYQHR